MCGRIYQTLPLHRLVSIARARMASNPSAYTSSFNVCPTTFIPAIRSNKKFIAQQMPSQKQKEKEKEKEDNTNIIRAEEVKQESEEQKPLNQEEQNNEKQYELSFSKWGLKTKYNLVTNCRTQEMFLKPTFTKLMKNRCVIIMQGYYQWNTQKQPYLFKSKTQDHILVAGLFNQQDEIVLLTRDAAPNLKTVHHRMPVVLSSQEVKIWLDEENDKIIGSIVEQLFLGKEKQVWDTIEMSKLAPYVNSIKEKSAKCIMTYEDYQKQLDRTGIMRFFKKKEAPKVEIIGNDGQILVVPEGKNIQQNQEVDIQDKKLEDKQKENINEFIEDIKQKMNQQQDKQQKQQNQDESEKQS